MKDCMAKFMFMILHNYISSIHMVAAVQFFWTTHGTGTRQSSKGIQKALEPYILYISSKTMEEVTETHEQSYTL